MTADFCDHECCTLITPLEELSQNIVLERAIDPWLASAGGVTQSTLAVSDISRASGNGASVSLKPDSRSMPLCSRPPVAFGVSLVLCELKRIIKKGKKRNIGADSRVVTVFHRKEELCSLRKQNQPRTESTT